jgi:hypothetical protein
MTLPYNTPLLEDEKRVQAIFLMEAFCPSLGWTKFFPDYTIVVDGEYLSQITIKDSNGKDQPIFDTTGFVPVKSTLTNTYEVSGQHSVGGHASPSAMVGNRGGRTVKGIHGKVSKNEVKMGADRNWADGNPSGHGGLSNYGLTSNFITVKRDAPMEIKFPTTELVIRIFDTHFWNSPNAAAIQVIRVRFNDPNVPMKFPTPALVGTEVVGQPPNLNYDSRPDTNTGEIRYRRSLQPPHWWCFNFEGCLGRMRGRFNPAWNGMNA